MPKQSELQKKIRELEQRARALRQGDSMVRRQSIDYVPAKKKSKPLGYKLQNTFEKSLSGVPGGSMSRGVAISLWKQIQASSTGTRVVEKAPGQMRSTRNANTTSGNYNQTVLRDQTGDIVSYVDGRRK